MLCALLRNALNGHVTQRNNRSDVLSGMLLSLLSDTLLFAKKNMIVF